MSATQIPATAPIRASDRLSFTLFIALIVHAIVILGVGFSHLDFSTNIPPALDVILVQSHTDTTPEKADYLAQVSQQGGGDAEERARPTTPFSAPEPAPTDGLAAVKLDASAPQESIQNQQPVLTQQYAEEQIQPKENESKPLESPKKRLSPDIIEQSLEIARLTAEINSALENRAKRPRKEYVDASTQGTPSAAYMHAWVKKIERVGNLNYPDEARRNSLSGTLILTAVVNSDGSLRDTILVESSGKAVLDQAAARIVELGAPYGPFPKQLKEKADILYITRTWQFLSNNSLTSN